MFRTNKWQKIISNLILATAFALPLVGLSAQSAFTQEHGAIPTPQVRPQINQLGQMEGVPAPDRVVLALIMFVQVVTCVSVAVALAGHLSLPPRKKT
jgi:hypothetical protein